MSSTRVTEFDERQRVVRQSCTMDSGGGGGYGSGRRTSLTGGRSATPAGYHRSTSSFMLQHGEPTFGDLALPPGEAHGVRPQALDVSSSEDPPRSRTPARRRSLSGRSHVDDGEPSGRRGRESPGVSDVQYGKAPSRTADRRPYAESHGPMSAPNEVVAAAEGGNGDIVGAAVHRRITTDHLGPSSGYAGLIAHEHASHGVATSMAADGSGRAHAPHASSHNYVTGPYDGADHTAQAPESGLVGGQGSQVGEPAVTHSRHTSRRSSSSHSTYGSRAAIDVHNGDRDEREPRLNAAAPPPPQSQPPLQPHAVPSPQLQQHQQQHQQFVRVPSYESEEADALMFNRFGSPALVTRLARASLDRQARRHSGLGEQYVGGAGYRGWMEGGGGVASGGVGGSGHVGEAIVHAAPLVLQHPDVSRRRRSYTGEHKEVADDYVSAAYADHTEVADAVSHAQARVDAGSGESTDAEGFAARERRRRSVRHSRADDGRARQGSLSSIAEHQSLDSDARLYAEDPVGALLQQPQSLAPPQRQPSGQPAVSPQQSAVDGQEARRRTSVESYISHTSMSSVGSGSRFEDGRREDTAYVRQTEDAAHDVGGGESYTDDDDQRHRQSRGMARKGSDHHYNHSSMAFQTDVSAVDGELKPAPQPPDVHVLGSAHLAASSDTSLPPPPPPQPQQAQHEAQHRSRHIAREGSRGSTQSSHGRRRSSSCSVELIDAHDASARHREGSYAPHSDIGAECRRTVAAGAQGPHSYVQEPEQHSTHQQQVQHGHVEHQPEERTFDAHARHASWSTENHDHDQQHVHVPVQRAPSSSTAEGRPVSQQPRAGEGHSRAMMRRASASAAVDLTARQGREVRRSVSEPAEDRDRRSGHGQGVSVSAARRKTMGPGVQLQQPPAYQQQQSSGQQQQQQHLLQAQWSQQSSHREHYSHQQPQHELHVQHGEPHDTVASSPHSSHPPSPHARPNSSSSSSTSAPPHRRHKQSTAHNSVSGAGELHHRRPSRQSSSGQEAPAPAPVDSYDDRHDTAPFSEGRRDGSSYEHAAAAEDVRVAGASRTGSAVAPEYRQRVSMAPGEYDDTDDLAATETPAYEQPQQSWSTEGGAHHVQHVPAHRERNSVDAGDQHSSPPRSRQHTRHSSSISSPPAASRRYTRAGSQLRPEWAMGDGDDERDPHTTPSARRASYESHRDGSAYLNHREPPQSMHSHERRSSVLRRPSVDTTEREDSRQRMAENEHDRHGSADTSRRLSWDLDGGNVRRGDVLHSNQSDHHGAHERGTRGGEPHVDVDARYGHRGSQRGSVEFVSEQMPHGGQPQQSMDPEILYLFRGLHREVDTLRQSVSELSDSTGEEIDALRIHADARYDEVKGQLGECLVYLRDVKQALEGLAKQTEGMRKGLVRTEVGEEVGREHRQQQQLHSPDKQQQQQQQQQPPPAYRAPDSSSREHADPSCMPQPDAYIHHPASTPQPSPLRPPPPPAPSLPPQHQQEQSPCRTPRAWHRMSDDRQRLLEEWIDHLEASQKSTKEVNRASLSPNEHPRGRENPSARDGMRDTLKDMRERQQALEEVAAGMRVEMYRLEEKVGNEAQESRQRFDTVKKAFRMFADAVHVDLPSSMWRNGLRCSNISSDTSLCTL